MTVFAIVALVLSMLTFMPSMAMAQEEDSNGTSEATEPVVEDFEIEQEEVVIPTVEPDNSLAEVEDALNSGQVRRSGVSAFR